jgi:N utilization substance protein B
MRARSRARGWALQLLYSWDMRGRAVPLSEARADFVQERRIGDANREYLDRLVVLISDSLPAIDRALDTSLTNWRLERLSAIDRNILRLAAAEMLYLDDVPPRVSIQEAILLAEKYGTADSPRFVNGVLDALMRSTREDRGATGRGEAR